MESKAWRDLIISRSKKCGWANTGEEQNGQSLCVVYWGMGAVRAFGSPSRCRLSVWWLEYSLGVRVVGNKAHEK